MGNTGLVYGRRATPPEWGGGGLLGWRGSGAWIWLRIAIGQLAAIMFDCGGRPNWFLGCHFVNDGHSITAKSGFGCARGLQEVYKRYR